ncbi:hypothetical protein MTR_4g080803 [Medicago truncatula]|uniref:Uncharacterized protein n=1 Tax=Medicago truncatula TaxID=3880 RepID=A0A072UMZ1_MEDTR|nr:hypothetical protein MTR_4g080803 [Medicago truncatula]
MTSRNQFVLLDKLCWLGNGTVNCLECHHEPSDDEDEGLHDISGIELVAVVEQPLGLHLEVKNCGYHWIFKEDLEHLNAQMMHSRSGNSSVQIKYVTNA